MHCALQLVQPGLESLKTDATHSLTHQKHRSIKRIAAINWIITVNEWEEASVAENHPWVTLAFNNFHNIAMKYLIPMKILLILQKMK